MADYVSKYTCGTCEYYEYEGKNTKGYCSWYKTYYWDDDSCSHWKEKEESSGSGCYLTSACCEYKGLPDDCAELQTLRRFRDTYLKEQDYGMEMIKTYYADAPGIVEAINQSEARDEIYHDIYEKILQIVKLIDDQKYDRAVIEYMLMVYRLKKMA